MAGLLWYRSYMDSLANTSGYYPDIHAGHADRVAGLTLEAPYLVRETPAGFNKLELSQIIGGTVAWNQLVPNENKSFSNSSTDTRSNVSFLFRKNSSPWTILVQKDITAVGSYDFVTTATFSGTAQIVHSGLQNNFTFANNISVENGHKYLLHIKFTGVTPGTVGGVVSDDLMLIDLTSYLNPTIGDYVYSLEQATARSGIAWLKKYDLIDDQYHAHSTPTLESVEATAHVTKDSNNTTIATYPLDSDLVLRGIPKLDNGVLSYDGDTYEWNGTVTRKYGTRAYQAGDESLTDAITDGTNTVYKLTIPTTESADPFTAVQTVEDGGTEEFVTSNNVPVGNVSVYREA